MLVKVRFGETQKYVKVVHTEEGYEDFNTFLQKAIEKLGLPLQTELHVTDESGTEVDADVFEELLQAGNLTIHVSTEKSTVVPNHSSSESHCAMSSSVASDSSDSTVILDRSNAQKITHIERELANEMVRNVLQSMPGGEKIFHEYEITKTLTDATWRQMVNLLVADMMEVHGDPYSGNGYEHYYDAESGSGYLAWRIKTVQRNTAVQSRRCSTSTKYGPKSKRDDKQLFGEECREAISLLKHSTDVSVVEDKMKATFQYRQTLVQDQQNSATVLDVFLRFLDIPGLSCICERLLDVLAQEADHTPGSVHNTTACLIWKFLCSERSQISLLMKIKLLF